MWYVWITEVLTILIDDDTPWCSMLHVCLRPSPVCQCDVVEVRWLFILLTGCCVLQKRRVGSTFQWHWRHAARSDGRTWWNVEAARLSSPFSHLSAAEALSHSEERHVLTKCFASSAYSYSTLLSRVKNSRALNDTPSLIYRVSLPIWDHTVLRVIPTQVNTPLTSAGGHYLIYLPRKDRSWVYLGDQLRTEMVYLPIDGHPWSQTDDLLIASPTP